MLSCGIHTVTTNVSKNKVGKGTEGQKRERKRRKGKGNRVEGGSDGGRERGRERGRQKGSTGSTGSTRGYGLPLRSFHWAASGSGAHRQCPCSLRGNTGGGGEGEGGGQRVYRKEGNGGQGMGEDSERGGERGRERGRGGGREREGEGARERERERGREKNQEREGEREERREEGANRELTNSNTELFIPTLTVSRSSQAYQSTPHARVVSHDLQLESTASHLTTFPPYEQTAHASSS